MGKLRSRSGLAAVGLLWGWRASWSTVDAAESSKDDLPAAAAAAAGTNATCSDREACTMWIAPSTIPGAGLGIYAGKDFGLWEPIGSPDLVIPIVDYHQHHPEHDDEIIFDFYGWNVWRYVAGEGWNVHPGRYITK